MDKDLRCTNSSRGAALIVAIFALMILTALAVAFASIARTDVILAGNHRTRVQGMSAAQSGVQYCRALLVSDDAGVDSTNEDWALVQDQPIALDVPGFTVNAAVTDESARLDVNTATREMLLRLPGMTEQAADSILDWRDADEEPRAEGAESDYYLSLPSPYQASNAPFETIDELRLVRGVDRQMFEGDGTDALPGLRSLVTVRSGERNTDRQGRRRLDITSATAAQLTQRLAGVMSGQEITAIANARQRRGLTSLASTFDIAGVSWRSMAHALDLICVDTRTFVEGTVNLNTASETVLEAIGLPAEAAQAIIERRTEQPLQTKGDLADIAGVTRDVMRSVADRIATKSSIFRVSAWAQADDRPLVSSVFTLLDRGSSPSTPARILLWREEFGRQPQPASSEGQQSGSTISGS